MKRWAKILLWVMLGLALGVAQSWWQKSRTPAPFPGQVVTDTRLI